MVSLRKINKWLQYITVAVGISGILLVAYIIYTSPNDIVEVGGGDICIIDDDDTYHWNDDGSLMSYDELFPAGNEYGKDGEIIDESTIDESILNTPMPKIYWVIPPIQHKEGCRKATGVDTSVVEEPSTLSLLAFLPIFLVIGWITRWR